MLILSSSSRLCMSLGSHQISFSQFLLPLKRDLEIMACRGHRDAPSRLSSQGRDASATVLSLVQTSSSILRKGKVLHLKAQFFGVHSPQDGDVPQAVLNSFIRWR